MPSEMPIPQAVPPLGDELASGAPKSTTEQRVHPTMVRKDSAIAQVMGVTNAVTIDAEGLNPLTLIGPGAGGAATASAVIADIADIARGVRIAPFGLPSRKLTQVR